MQTLTASPPSSIFHLDILKVLFGGLTASLAMTAVVYLGPLVGIPNVDFAAMLGSLVTAEPPAMFTPGWWAGLAWHLANGTVIFAAIYAVLIRGLVPVHPIVRGLIFAAGLWVLCQAMAMPIVGGGFFSELTSDPTQVVLGSLFAHLIYGVVLGAMVKEENVATVTHESTTEEDTRTQKAA